MEIFVSTFLLSVFTWAASPNLSEALNSGICQSEIKEKLGTWLIKQSWVSAAISVPMEDLLTGVSFRDTVHKKNHFLGFTSEFARLEISDTGAETLEVFKWDNKCKLQSFKETRAYPKLSASTGFTDKDLFDFISKYKKGVVYIWSPYMPLSVEGLSEIKEAARKENLSLLILMDDKATEEDAKKWKVSGSDVRRLASQEIYFREVSLHYPVVYVFRDGFLSNRSFRGFKKESDFTKWVRQEYSQLEQEMAP